MMSGNKSTVLRAEKADPEEKQVLLFPRSLEKIGYDLFMKV
jgi:hypothetical protein